MPPLPLVDRAPAEAARTGAGGTGLSGIGAELPPNRPENKLPAGAPGSDATGIP